MQHSIFRLWDDSSQTLTFWLFTFFAILLTLQGSWRKRRIHTILGLHFLYILEIKVDPSFHAAWVREYRTSLGLAHFYSSVSNVPPQHNIWNQPCDSYPIYMGVNDRNHFQTLLHQVSSLSFDICLNLRKLVITKFAVFTPQRSSYRKGDKEV